MIGKVLGPYQILSKLGEGGMGEVYRATDTKLNRDVAIKIVPEVFAQDAGRLARFTREAQTLASLNHPNIAQIHGLEEQAAVKAIVMELVEGDDLSTIIARGPMPPGDALPIARQIAEALDAAHEAGVVHRDLKPANIKVRADGTVKVLDFGLAKATDPAGASGTHVANSPTLTAHGTQMGMIIGTAAYMAPEQAKGRAVDRRADIWAFGVVLYEMLAGRPAFAGETTTEILGAVVLKEPDWSALPAVTPAALRALLLRCMQKDPRVRQRDIGDVKLELDAIAAGGGQAAPVVQPRARAPLAAIAAIVVAAAALGGVVGGELSRRSATPATTTRFLVDGPGGLGPYSPLLSPDGRFLVFATNRLYKRDFSAFAAEALPGTEGAGSPFMSPDGQWIGFFANGKIKKVSVGGGDPVTLAEANPSMPGAAWGVGNTILFSPGWATGLFSLPADGGEARPFTEPDRTQGERGHWRPRVLPGEQFLLFTIWMAGSGVNDARVGLLDLKTRRHRALFPGANAQYLPSGHVLYFHAGAWHIVRFDAAAGTVIGEPSTMLDDALGVLPDGSNGHIAAVSDTGTLAYVNGPLMFKRELVWVDRNGTIEPLGLPPRTLLSASLSPDGRRVAVSRLEGGTYELWINDVERKTEDRLDIKGMNFSAFWDPRGESIVFVSERKGEYDVYTARADGGNVQPLLTNDFDEQAWAWARDGRRLVVQQWHADGTTPLVLIDTSAKNPQQATTPLRSQPSTANFVALSPDERWLLFSASSSGRPEIYVQPFPTGTPVVRVSSNGGGEPLWSPTGNEILFRRDTEVVSVSYRQAGGRFVAEGEKPLFRIPSASYLYGITPDGRRLLVGRPAEPEPARGIRVVLNWQEELKARLTTK